MMRIPGVEVSLPGGMRCVPAEVPLHVWQAHLLKHPLGVEGARRAGRVEAWNVERWDETAPPVVDVAGRDALLAQIAALGDARQKCRVPAVAGKVAKELEPECYACKPPLLTGCARILEGVGGAYATHVEQLLSALGDAVTHPRERVTKLLYGKLKTPEVWADLVLLSTGNAAGRGGWVVRLTRGDGVRVELDIGAENRATWRTTYREPRAVKLHALGFLTDPPIRHPKVPLSDLYAVPRGWWERHG